ncbi:MAG: hypothetical protein PHS66_07890 [Candidatus Omnitrophica bacterium]|nr:hypothetical protein [Candidatus Omnitrophota bacterium]
MPKEDFYKGIKLVGFVSFIPFILAAGPLSGYFAWDFLQKKFSLPYFSVYFGVTFGFLIAVVEIVKILKAIARMNNR